MIEATSHEGIEYVQRLREFLKARAKLERSYAHSLEKLVRGAAVQETKIRRKGRVVPEEAETPR